MRTRKFHTGAVQALSIVVATFCIFSAKAVADEGICRDAGLTGKGFGLCTAYCEAMDCDSDNPNANETACGEVQSKFVETTGLAEMPCGDGTGEPPAPSITCPCDFSLGTWEAVLNDPNWLKSCFRVSDTDQEALSFQAVDFSISTQIKLSAAVQDYAWNDPSGRYQGAAVCLGQERDTDTLDILFAPRPLGIAVFQHNFENERAPEQVALYEACRQDIEALIASIPDLVCF